MSGAWARLGRSLAALAAAALLGLPQPGLALQPGEVLDDPVLEARARSLSSELRCVVCRNEAIDESNADIAGDMRVLLRERLVAGDSDEQVLAFFVERYGEYVLFRPQTDGTNLILWIAAPAMLAGGILTAAVYVRRRREPQSVEELTPEEQARLRELLRD